MATLPYDPTIFVKDGQSQTVTSWPEHYQALWDGWRPEGAAPDQAPFFYSVTREELANFDSDPDVRHFRQTLTDFIAAIATGGDTSPFIERLDEAVALAETSAAVARDISNIDTTVSAVDFALGQPGPAATIDAAIADGLAADADDPNGVIPTAVNELGTRGFVLRRGDVLSALEHVNYTAHRSGAGDYPENTMYAYESSFEVGAEFFDIDLHTLSDGTMAPFHDAGNVENLTDGFGQLPTFTGPRFKRLNANISGLHPGLGDLPPVTLPELMNQFGSQVSFLFDVQTVGEINNLANLIDRYDLRRSCLIGCHTLETLTAIKARSDADVAAGKQPLLYFQSWVTYIHGTPPTFTNPTPAQAIALGARLFSFPGNLASSPSMAATLLAATAGTDVKLRTYTINRRSLRDSLVAAGVTSFQTDHPAYVLNTKPLSKVDSWRDGLRGYGLQMDLPFWGRNPNLRVVNGGLEFKAPFGTGYVLIGEVSPIKPPPYSFEIEAGFTGTLPTNAAASIRLAFGCSDDRIILSGVYTQNSGQVFINKAGEARLYHASSGTTLTQVGASWATGAFVSDTPKKVRVDVTTANITVTVDALTPQVFTNPGIGGGYFQIGTVNANDAWARFKGLDTALV